MSNERHRSQTMPQQPKPAMMQRRDNRRSARPFQAAPLMVVDEETDGDEPKKESKTRRFFRAIGFGCFMSKGKHDKNAPNDPALRAITIEGARYAFNQSVLDSEDGGSMYSSYYGGNGGREHNQYQLYLGTENKPNLKPNFPRDPVKLGEPQVMDLSELRPSMTERQLPVFFVPPPADIVAAVTPRRKGAPTYVSPPDSSRTTFA